MEKIGEYLWTLRFEKIKNLRKRACDYWTKFKGINKRTMIFPKYKVRNKPKKDLLMLILRVFFLFFALIAVLWIRHQLKKKSSEPSEWHVLERKAKFITPGKEGEAAP